MHLAPSIIAFVLSTSAMAQTAVPLGGNSWLSANARASITDQGLTNWTNAGDVVSVYVRPEMAGDLNIALKLRVEKGKTEIKLTALGNSFTRTVSNTQFEVLDFGSISIKDPCYIRIDISKTGNTLADISDLVINGIALKNGAAYVKDNEGNYFYWGRRGPSVHLNYIVPAEARHTSEWFYNEVTVPVGQDISGSFFMADGFSGGYFGMQVNSETERHVLFSVWSPYSTDDPNTIPDSLKVRLLKKGNKVHGGEFGGEGSGGQSYMNYLWVAGQTYCFLIRAQGDSVAKTTIYSAWFKPLNAREWQLVASFKRPKIGSYLSGLHSFLENFDPKNGNLSRKVFFGNQWIVDLNGKWYPLNKAVFTGDATANSNYRKDYSGGVDGSLFYLRNCGFFNDFTVLLSMLNKVPDTTPQPQIEFSKLP